MKRTKEQEIALEIGNELIKTLGSMPAQEADRIVRAQTERLINELGGMKGRIKSSYGCIQFKDKPAVGSATHMFVEE